MGVDIGLDLVRYCSLRRLLDWGTYFGAIFPLGHSKLNYRVLHRQNGSKGKSARFGGRKVGF